MKRFLLGILTVAFFATVAFANPFVDVPVNHWAYEAVNSLVSRGIVEGYPDGTFKGNQTQTRYEFAMQVARMMAVVDFEKASKEDVRLLQRLAVEFNSELEALGVKVSEIDSRLVVVEDNLNNFHFSGEFRFDTTHQTKDSLSPKTSMDVSRFRLYMHKHIDENVSWFGRLGGESLEWERFYVTVKLPFNLTYIAGKSEFDWESEAGLVSDDDSIFALYGELGHRVRMSILGGNLDLFWFMRNDEPIFSFDGTVDRTQSLYGLRYFSGTEMIQFGFFGYQFKDSFDGFPEPKLYGVDVGANFGGVSVKGLYSKMDIEFPVIGSPDNPTHWKGMVTVDRDVLRFTDLTVEYAHFDPYFLVMNTPYNFILNSTGGVLEGGQFVPEETNVLFVRANQMLFDKVETTQRFVQTKLVDSNETNKTYSFSVKYHYTPSMFFELGYEHLNHFDNDLNDERVRFRVMVYF